MNALESWLGSRTSSQVPPNSNAILAKFLLFVPYAIDLNLSLLLAGDFLMASTPSIGYLPSPSDIMTRTKLSKLSLYFSIKSLAMMSGGLNQVPFFGSYNDDKILCDGICASISNKAVLLQVIIETLELFLSKVSFSIMAVNQETADVRFIHLL